MMAYSGQDFPATIPGTQQLYELDFSGVIAIEATTVATVGGTPTAGDTVGIMFTEIALPQGDLTISYVVQPTDTLNSIAAALAAEINGTEELTDIGISATVTGAAISVQYPTSLSLLLDAAIFAPPPAQPTETIEFSAGPYAGETITSATWSCEQYLGGSDPDPSSRIIGSAIISGPKVSTKAGNFIAGNTYRLACTVVTGQQPALIIYSHVACELPQ